MSFRNTWATSCPMLVLIFLHIAMPLVVNFGVTGFQLPSEDIGKVSSNSRKSGQGHSNFRNEGDDMPDVTFTQIIQDTKLRQRTSTQEFRRHRYKDTKRQKLNTQNNTKTTCATENSTITPATKTSTAIEENALAQHDRHEPEQPKGEQQHVSFQQLNQKSAVSLKLSELSEWANQGNGKKAEAILIRLEKEGNVPRNAYLATIRAWLSSNQVYQALAVMARMEESKHRVKAADYRPILQTMIRTTPSSPNDAIRLLNHMAKCTTGRPILKEYDFEDPKRRQSIWTSLTCSELPDERCLMIVCNEFVKRQLPDRCKVVCDIYEWAKEHDRADNYLLHIALSALGDNPRHAEKFLLLHADVNTHAICYMTVLQAYCKHPNVYQRGKKMESILRRIETLQPGGAIQPDLVTYRQIMQAYLGDKDGMESARFLNKAFQDVLGNRIQGRMDLFLSWSKCVMDQIAKGDFDTNGERAILQTVQSLEQFSHFFNETVNIEFYHFVMDNYIRAKGAKSIPFVEYVFSQVRKRYQQSQNPEQAPTSKTINIGATVLKAYSKSKDAVIMEKAEGILFRMEEIYQREKDSRNCIIPDVVSYTTVIQGWAACRSPDAILRADMIAKRLNKMHLSGNDAAKADRGVGVALLNANIWNGQARKELGIHGNLQDHTSIETLVNATPPDMVSLSKIIKEMKSSDAGEKAEEIIDLLLSRYKYCGSEDVLPDAQLFTSAISAWGRSRQSNAAAKAELILDKMMLLFDLTKAEKMKPNGQHFLAVIRAYSQPNQPDKALHAKRVFDEMMALYEDGFLVDAPSRETFTAVLKACCHAKGIAREKKRELQICESIFAMIDSGEYCSHNEATYGAYIGAIRNCMERGPERKRVLKLAFDKCANDGFVDGFILGQLRRSVSSEEFQDIVGKDLGEKAALDVDVHPTYSRRNVMNRS